MIANSLSLLNLLFGFFSIISSINGYFNIAVSLILLSMLLDLFDGRIARLLKSKSMLGKHLDTYADLITFCISPAILFYSLIWGEHNIYPELKNYLFFRSHLSGAIISSLFPFFGAIRLAIFSENAVNATEKKSYFTGLPSTFAGGSVSLIIAFKYVPSFTDSLLRNYDLKLPVYIMIPVFIFYALIMVSKLKCPRAGADFLSIRKGIPVWKVLISVFFIILVIFLTKYFLVIGAFYYLIKTVIMQKSFK